MHVKNIPPLHNVPSEDESVTLSSQSLLRSQTRNFEIQLLFKHLNLSSQDIVV